MAIGDTNAIRSQPIKRIIWRPETISSSSTMHESSCSTVNLKNTQVPANYCFRWPKGCAIAFDRAL
jgi:hypothetical protein